MNFNSYIFIFLFLPIVVWGWFFFNEKEKYNTAKYYLLTMSLIFYSYANVYYLFLIIFSIGFNYLTSHFFESKFILKSNKIRVFLLFAAVSVNLGILFYFKYYNFFVENINIVLDTSWTIKNIALPLGISFYTFQQISFIVDRYRKEAPHYKLIDYMLFVTYFPQLVAGPIVRHKDLITQFQNEELKKINWDNITKGFILFILGLSKKMLLADTLNLMVEYGYQNISTLDSASLLLVALTYTFQIYFDFSGYSDMALGLAKMMNIELPINFNFPYKSKSIKEFWKRWHITLNEFLTQYVYIPLGGNKKGKLYTICNILIVFLLSGIWHGANWTFILWGVLQGIIIVVETLLNKKKKDNIIAWGITFALINLSWIIFRSDTLETALLYYEKMFSFSWNGSIQSLAYSLDNSTIHFLLSLIKRISGNLVPAFYMVYMLVILGAAIFFCRKGESHEFIRKYEINSKSKLLWCLAILFVLDVISLSNADVFLYVNF